MKPFNEQAAFLIENALDLIKQVLIKHSAAVLEEMRDQIVARNTRIAALEAENEALRKDAERYRWLRDGDADAATKDFPIAKGCVTNNSLWDHKLDAAIDAARKAQQ